MPNIKASKKAVKVIEKKTEANHEYVARVKNSMRKLEKAVKANETESVDKMYKETIKYIDKAVSKGLMKKNTADREKSRLYKIVKEMK